MINSSLANRLIDLNFHFNRDDFDITRNIDIENVHVELDDFETKNLFVSRTQFNIRSIFQNKDIKIDALKQKNQVLRVTNR